MKTQTRKTTNKNGMQVEMRRLFENGELEVVVVKYRKIKQAPEKNPIWAELGIEEARQ